MKIKQLAVVVVVSVIPVVLTLGAQLCPKRYYSRNDIVSRCTDCASGNRSPDTSECLVSIYDDNVLCDCRPDYRCYDDPEASLGNYTYNLYGGMCFYGRCIINPFPVGGPSLDQLKIKCADPCAGG
jgi:hypothetical protein